MLGTAGRGSYNFTMTTVPCFHVDAFTTTSFRGNPAAVCLLTEARLLADRIDARDVKRGHQRRDHDPGQSGAATDIEHALGVAGGRA